jgi:hypothetical protein
VSGILDVTFFRTLKEAFSGSTDAMTSNGHDAVREVAFPANGLSAHTTALNQPSLYV